MARLLELQMLHAPFPEERHWKCYNYLFFLVKVVLKFLTLSSIDRPLPAFIAQCVPAEDTFKILQ